MEDKHGLKRLILLDKMRYDMYHIDELVNGFTGSTDKIEMKSKGKIKKRDGKAIFFGMSCERNHNK
jgi:hypothetical protein